MNPRLIVTHCLALLNEHAGAMSQADKDFFDTRVEAAMTEADDVFVAVLLLLTMRLSLDLPEQEAERAALELTEHQAERYGVGLPARI